MLEYLLFFSYHHLAMLLPSEYLQLKILHTYFWNFVNLPKVFLSSVTLAGSSFPSLLTYPSIFVIQHYYIIFPPFLTFAFCCLFLSVTFYIHLRQKNHMVRQTTILYAQHIQNIHSLKHPPILSSSAYQSHPLGYCPHTILVCLHLQDP